MFTAGARACSECTAPRGSAYSVLLHIASGSHTFRLILSPPPGLACARCRSSVERQPRHRETRRSRSLSHSLVASCDRGSSSDSGRTDTDAAIVACCTRGRRRSTLARRLPARRLALNKVEERTCSNWVRSGTRRASCFWRADKKATGAWVHWPPERKHYRALGGWHSHRHSKRRVRHPDGWPSPFRFTTLRVDVRWDALQACIGRARIAQSDLTDSDSCASPSCTAAGTPRGRSFPRRARFPSRGWHRAARTAASRSRGQCPRPRAREPRRDRTGT